MRKITLALFSLLGSLTITAQVISTYNETSSGSCNGYAILNDTTNYSSPVWKKDTVVLQTGGTYLGALCAGSYHLLVDSNGTQVTLYFGIGTSSPCDNFGANAYPTMTSNTACTGTANAYGFGGMGAYSYSWNTGDLVPLIDSLCAGTYTVTVSDTSGCSAVKTVTVNVDTVGPCGGFSVTTNATPETSIGGCNGSANAYTNGGVPPYNFSWSSGHTNPYADSLCAGSYTLTVTDYNNCTASTVVNIITDTSGCFGFDANFSTTPETGFGSCNGSANAYGVGGVPPYAYNWSNGDSMSSIMGLCAGMYTLMVTDYNGCNVNKQVYINTDTTQTGPCMGIYLNVTPTGISASGMCDGSATASVTGSSSPYTLTWSNSATGSTVSNLCQDMYTVFYSDSNGCNLQQQVMINVNGGPCSNFMVNAYSSPTAQGACTGTANAYVSGGGAGMLSYTWMPGGMTTPQVSGLCAGTYTVTASDSTCSATKTVTVMPDTMQNPCNITITVMGVTPDAGTCNGTANVIANGGAGGYTFYWTPNGATTPMTSGLCAGSYSVTVTDVNNCSANTQVFVVLDSTGTNPCINSNLNISIVNILQATQGNCDGFASAFASGGHAPYMFNWSHDSSLTTNNAANLCAGSYFVSVVDNKGCVSSTQFSLFEDSNIVVTDPCVGFFVTAGGTSMASNCNGSATANVYGGTAPFNYLWSNGQYGQSIANLCPGVYQVSVYDANGCATSSTGFYVFGDSASQIAPLSVYVNSTDATDINTCDGSAVTYVTGGLPPYTYMYSDSSSNAVASSLCPNFYSVTVTDANGLTKVSTFVIVGMNDIFQDTSSNNPYIDSVIVAEVTAPADEDCNIDYTTIDSVYITSYTLQGDTLVAVWSVFINGVATTVTSYYVVGPDGVYTLVLELYCDGTPKMAGATGSMKAKDQVLLSTTGIAKTTANVGGVKAYPVPFNNLLNLSFGNAGTYNVSVYDVLGKQVMNQVQLTGNSVHALNLSTLNTGYYMVKVQSGNSVDYIKVVKE